jgi:signal peptidase I
MIPSAPHRFAWLRRAIREILETTVLSLLMYLVLSTLIGRFEIQQVSMEPNLHEGQRVIVSRLESLLSPWLARTAYAADREHVVLLQPRRGQVIVFNDPDGGALPLIKRVIAVPSDTLEMAGGAVWVDGRQLDEPYVHGLSTSCSHDCGPLTLGPGLYFVMGDNRPNSRDSRSFGPIAGDQIIGHVIVRYWPLSSIEFYP